MNCLVRPYHPDDLPQLERMHKAQGFAFPFPDLSDPLWHIGLVTEHDGRIVNAAFAHLTAEVQGFFDREFGTPRERLAHLKMLHEVGCRVAYEHGGLSELHVWIPPEIEKSFGRRLMHMGWKKALWPCLFKELGPRKEN